jgi:hypothetical protein
MSTTVTTTTPTTSSNSSGIAVPVNPSPDYPAPTPRETLTQGLWRFPILPSVETLNPPSSKSSSGTGSTTKVHRDHSESRTTALASTIGVKESILDISPHEFWNRVMNIDGKEIVVVINGDLIRDRIRNQSLPWYLPLSSYYTFSLFTTFAHIFRPAN